MSEKIKVLFVCLGNICRSPTADEIKIREGLQARLGLAVDIQIEILKKIPPEKSGKHRYVVSHVEARKTP